MIVAIATMRMDEDTTVQVHVPMDVEIMQVPPTDKEVEKIKSVLEEETGYKFVSLDSITWANGDWENLGPIKLAGNNKTFVANTRQKVANY